jgi:alpha-L-arabinofuranosidase
MKLSSGILLTAFLLISNSTTAQVVISVDASQKSHIISPMIQGHGLSYSVETDAIYNTGAMAQLYQDVGAGFLRWPGGTPTSMYHWNDLAAGWVDNWNPNYPESWDPESWEYMDLDEYMTLTIAAGTEPMLGINMSSGIEWHREADCLNEAVALVKYCQSKNFDAKCFYLDNEPYHSGNGYNKDKAGDGGHWTATTYAQKFNLYADSIRKYLPDAVLFANWKEHLRDNTSDYNTIINIAGDNIDYIDVHWYWKWGAATWDAWIAKTPMENETEWYNGGTYVEETKYFNNLATSLGHSHIKLASLEWNIAPGDHNKNPDHTEFMTALMQSEMQMQMMQAGIDFASMWTTQWPESSEAEFLQLINSDDNYAPSAAAAMFQLYKNAQNGVVMKSSATDNNVLTTSVLNEGDKACIFILNKNNSETEMNISINALSIISVEQALCFQDPGVTEDINVQVEDAGYTVTVPEYSLTMIEFLVEESEPSSNNESYQEEVKIELYPNPASNTICLKTKKFKGNAILELYNVRGENVFSQSINSQNTENYEFSVQHLPTGTYYINIIDDGGQHFGSKLMIK